MMRAPVDVANANEHVPVRHAGVFLPRRGAEKEIPIQPRRHRLWRPVVNPFIRATRTERVNLLEFANRAVADEFAGAPEIAPILGTLLRAGLEYTAIAQHGFLDCLTLPDGDGDGLLAINILARPGRHDGHHAMPVNRRGEQHGVNVVTRQHVAKIPIRLTGTVSALAGHYGVVLIDPARRIVAAILPRIADG